MSAFAGASAPPTVPVVASGVDVPDAHTCVTFGLLPTVVPVGGAARALTSVLPIQTASSAVSSCSVVSELFADSIKPLVPSHSDEAVAIITDAADYGASMRAYAILIRVAKSSALPSLGHTTCLAVYVLNLCHCRYSGARPGMITKAVTPWSLSW